MWSGFNYIVPVCVSCNVGLVFVVLTTLSVQYDNIALNCWELGTQQLCWRHVVNKATNYPNQHPDLQAACSTCYMLQLWSTIMWAVSKLQRVQLISSRIILLEPCVGRSWGSVSFAHRFPLASFHLGYTQRVTETKREATLGKEANMSARLQDTNILDLGNSRWQSDLLSGCFGSFDQITWSSSLFLTLESCYPFSSVSRSRMNFNSMCKLLVTRKLFKACLIGVLWWSIEFQCLQFECPGTSVAYFPPSLWI